VILYCNYEETSALRSGARVFLERSSDDPRPVAAPPEAHDRVAALLPRLSGDFTVDTLADLRSIEAAVDPIVVLLRAEMEMLVAATHAADEQAVAAYFDFAHSYSVLARVRELIGEMEAMIELATGGPVTAQLVREFVFPD